jgi:hypothetical protein
VLSVKVSGATFINLKKYLKKYKIKIKIKKETIYKKYYYNN